MTTATLWIIIGLIGQGIFGLRFLWQWLQSEKQKCSVIPLGFWYLSVAGSLVILIYAIHKKDIVFTLGQLPGILIYIRNLYFIYHKKNI